MGLLWAVAGAAVGLAALAGGLYFFLTRGIDAPAGVAAAVRGGEVSVTWQPADGATTYEVSRDGQSLGTTTETSYVDEAAPGGTEHRYTVVAVGQGGDRSEVAAAAPVHTPVDAPASVSVAADHEDVQITWVSVTGADRYEISRGDDVLADDLTSTSYRDVGLPAGNYNYSVTAVDEDGPGSTASTTAGVFVPGPWGDAHEIAAQFPELIPEAPDGQSWQGSTCREEPGRDAPVRIVCTYPDGFFLEFIQFPGVRQRDAVVDRVVTEHPGTLVDVWSYGGGPVEGDLYLSPPGEDPGWLFWTFHEEERSLFTMWVEWAGHSSAEVHDTWFVNATF